MTALLDVKGLSVEYQDGIRSLRAVEGASFEVQRGRAVGLVGESGSGKTTLALSLMGLLPPTGRIVEGSVLLGGRDVTRLSEDKWRELRWGRIALVFQGGMNALNPVIRVVDQVAEPIRAHDPRVSKQQAQERARELLERVGIPRARSGAYPHQYSGGMRQRAVIAMALACEPEAVIADEPVTALDVVVQAQILRLLSSLQRELGLALLIITHDLGVIAQLCDDVLVMYAGHIVEGGPANQIFADPKHPYTSLLLDSVPSFDERLEIGGGIPGPPASLANPPSGCRFHPRCPHVLSVCSREIPVVHQFKDSHYARCHLYDE